VPLLSRQNGGVALTLRCIHDEDVRATHALSLPLVKRYRTQSPPCVVYANMSEAIRYDRHLLTWADTRAAPIQGINPSRDGSETCLYFHLGAVKYERIEKGKSVWKEGE